MSRTRIPAPAGSTALSRQSWRRRAVCWLAFLSVVVSTVALAAAATARSTALNPAYYEEVLDEQRAYDRLYDEVLVDPQSSEATGHILARLPVPQGIVTSNIKNVLPPEAVRALAEQQIGNAVGYLRGDRPALRLTADLRPVLANFEDLIRIYFGDLIAAVDEWPADDVDAAAAGLRGTADALPAAPVRQAAAFPALPAGVIAPQDVPAAAEALLSFLPDTARERLRPGLTAALGGEGRPAPTLAGPPSDGRFASGNVVLHREGTRWQVVADLEDQDRDGVALVRKARSIARLGLGPVQTAAVILGVAGLLALWAAVPGTYARRLTALGAATTAGGVLAAAAAGAGRIVAARAMPAPSASWPPSLARLVEDVQTTAADRLLQAGLLAALVPVTAGLLAAGTGLLWRTAGRRSAAGTPVSRPARAWAVTAGVAVIATAGAALAPTTVGGTPRRCQGSAAFCALRYDEVAQLAAHNAMSTTEDRFIGPLQDLGITAQLDAGVRALLVDTHTWETPEDVTGRINASGFRDRVPASDAALTRFVRRAGPARDGVWLCHSMCGGGAVALVPTLRKVGAWMRAHPTEVVTLIVQDGVSGEETVRAFREAGLEDLLYTPDADPGRPWPTLGEMVRSDRRLVVFAEQADGPAPWYRNFYRYAMETPFAFRSPQEMSCAPHRGGDGKRLFLLNHFVTRDGGSRLGAGQVNSRERVLERALACERERGRPVTFVAVDYTTIGDAKGAVDALNAARSSRERNGHEESRP
ncbi:hypothetical protein [Streptomyces sp. NPDC048639]|uniref:hypothetical protein n=1 Tax=Streptomyces sp. NPDC048639 TaxID=3365581 RepID=UPI00371463F2